MPRTGWTPSIALNGDDQNFYLVILGRRGRVFRDADLEGAGLETVVIDVPIKGLSGAGRTAAGASWKVSPR